MPSANTTQPQLQMVWPTSRGAAPDVPLPDAYRLRAHQPADTYRFFGLMATAGWPGWDEERLQPWLMRIIPNGWLLIEHVPDGRIVATTMALHDPNGPLPYSGEVGWVAAHPAHAGRRLGMVVVTAVTAHLLHAGYHYIHLYTEDFRLPALKTYLKLGFLPLLTTSQMANRWQRICTQLHWPFTPTAWPTEPTQA